MDKYEEEIINEQYNKIFKALIGTNFYGKPIDIANIKHLVTAAYELGKYYQLTSQQKDFKIKWIQLCDELPEGDEYFVDIRDRIRRKK